MSKRVNKQTPLIAACPGCEARYLMAPEVIEEGRERRILHQTCSACGRAMLLSFRLRPGGWVCAGLFTDCAADEVKRLFFGEKISVNDVLGAHNALQFDNFLKMR